VALGDDGRDCQQTRTFGCPVARRARAIFFARKNNQRRPRSLIFLACVEDRHFLIGGQVPCESSVDISQLVAQADVGKSPAYHHFVIAAPRAVGVEVGGLDAMLLQIFSGGTVLLDRSGGRNVVGSDAVSQYRQYAGRVNVLDGRGLELHVVEVRSAANVGGIFFPGVGLAFGNGEPAPALVTLKYFGVAFGKHFRSDRPPHRFLDFTLRGPEVGEVNRIAVSTFADSVFAKVC